MKVFEKEKCNKKIIANECVVFVSLSFQTETYGSIDYKFCVFKTGGISFAAFHIIFFSSSYLIPLTLIRYVVSLSNPGQTNLPNIPFSSVIWVISGLYAFMLRLWRTVVLHNRANESQRGRKRVTRLVFVVVAAFALLWLPIQVSLIDCA